jgi:phage-related protein
MKPVRFVGTARDDLAAFPAFQKKTPKTSRLDIEVARRRYRLIGGQS